VTTNTAERALMQEDRILLRLRLGDKAINSVEIQARQHLLASRVLEGKTRDEALKLLPMIYHVCARAHSFAAQQAFACALGTTMSNTLMHQLLVLAETCREHARRIFLDWPRLCGQTPDSEMVLKIQRHLQQLEQSVLTLIDTATSQIPQELLWQVQDLRSLLEPLHDEVVGVANTRTVVSAVIEAMHEQDITAIGSSDVPGLTIHEVDVSYLADQMRRDNKAHFLSAPHLHTQVYETGPLARMRGQAFIKGLSDCYGNGLLTRFCATVQELGAIPGLMLDLLQGQGAFSQQCKSIALSPVSGMGGVEAARGFLWHRVEMGQDRIKRYQILAPTEWNFHPRGALFRSLQGLQFQAKNQIHKLASMITTALDPCVACAIEVV
jgi:Ni,Fe-hydrogenase I large subunit